MNLTFDIYVSLKRYFKNVTGYVKNIVKYIKSGFSEEVGAGEMFGIHAIYVVLRLWIRMRLFREMKKMFSGLSQR